VSNNPTIGIDNEVRMAAFDWLKARETEYGDVLPRTMLSEGFTYHGQRVPLVGPQGIFKPRVLPKIPLSITTSPKSPYSDSFNPDGFLLYRYRGQDPDHHENVGLRNALLHNVPLVYFHGIIPGKYLAVWPVFIVGDNPSDLTFTVAVDDMTYLRRQKPHLGTAAYIADSDDEARRSYITYGVKHRLHQRGFRERVLAAYKDQCAFCRLRHRELLDAAHIIPDSEPGGDPVVNNGIALCKLHHAAFDNLFIGIRPDYRIVIREDLLNEIDGPMLQHGLKGLHLTKLSFPRRADLRPNPEHLAQRWERFSKQTISGANLLGGMNA